MFSWTPGWTAECGTLSQIALLGRKSWLNHVTSGIRGALGKSQRFRLHIKYHVHIDLRQCCCLSVNSEDWNSRGSTRGISVTAGVVITGAQSLIENPLIIRSINVT
jgi:hypothetical protein